MFTLEQAAQIREGLLPFDFDSVVSQDEVTQAYIRHYGLDFTDATYSVIHSMGVYPSPPYRIACQYFSRKGISNKGTIFIVHGYLDHVGLYNHLIKHCLDREYSVLAFDLPGHGLSDGDMAGIESFDRYSEALEGCLQLATRADIKQPWHLLGQSTGAAAIINFLLQPSRFESVTFEKIVLLAPLLRPVNWTRALAIYIPLHRFIKKSKRGFAANSHDKEFSRFIFEDDPFQSRYLKVDWVGSLKRYLARFKDAPICLAEIHIVQGTADQTVDWRNNLPVLEEKFPNAKTYMIKDARHHLVNEALEYRELIFETLDGILVARKTPV